MNERNYTVVLCDDEASVIAELRENMDWEALQLQIIATADNGKLALERILSLNPDLVIMDIRMPECDGLEVIANVRSAGMDTAFILLSGYDDFQFAQRAIQLGAKAYLLKPINTLQLSNEIYRILSQRATSHSSHFDLSYKKKIELNLFRNLLDGVIQDPMLVSSVLKNSGFGLRDSASFAMILSFPGLPPSDNSLFSKASEVLNQEFIGPKLFFSYKNGIVGILNHTEQLPAQSAQELLSILKNHALPTPVIGVGDTVSSIVELRYSYNIALTAMSYQLYDTERSIFTPEIICTIPPKKQLSDLNYLPLLQSIIRFERESIQQYCENFIEELLYVPMPAPNYIFSLCYALLHQIEQELSQYSHQEIAEITSAQSLYRCRSIDEILAFLIESFTHLSEYIDAVYGYGNVPAAPSEHAAPSDPLIQTALDYIKKNIAKNVKLSTIAREVHLSPSYFAILFKNKTGVCLRDYLSQEKMEYARKTLMDPSISLYELSDCLGYRDYRSFSRAFKSAHGITPAEFQNKYRH